MKPIFFSLILLAMVMISCHPNEKKKSGFRTHTQVTESFTSGDWGISSFIKDNVEHESRYTAFNFQFSPENAITVEDNVSKYNGWWSVGGIDGTDSKLPVDVSFQIELKSPPVLAALSENWTIVERTSWQLRLKRVNKNKGTDSLLFEKR